METVVNCPVCRSAQIGRPQQCRVCGTPLRRELYASRSLDTLLTLFLPGLGHYARGYFLKGSLALFGSFFALLYLFVGPYEYVALAKRVITWGVFWLIWLGVWRWDFSDLSRRFPSAGKLLSYLLIGLILSNVLMAVLIGVVLNRTMQF